MSRENIEVVRRKLEAHNVEDTAGFLDQWDPECEWFTVTGSQMDAAPYRGHEGIRRYLAERTELWSELRFDTEEALEGEDDDIVVVVGFLRGTGRRSGTPVEQRIGLVYELRGRKIRYCRAYRDPQDALAAAGLGDEADAAQAVVQVTRRGGDAE
jgi:ketosteroid isomerase-like protein